MPPTRIAAIVLAGLMMSPAIGHAGMPTGRRACRVLCADARHRCRSAGERVRRCLWQVRVECRQNGPEGVCRPDYTGTWTFTPTGEVTDTCALGAGADLTELTRMVVRESGDIVSARFGRGRDEIVGYLRPNGATILEGETVLGGCELTAEIGIDPPALLPRNAAEGDIHAGGICAGRTCDFRVEGRWNWQRE